MKSEQVNELAAALSKAQGEIANATMDKINPHFKSKYASLASVRDAIQGPLAKHGLAYTQATEIREGGLVLVTTLWHSSGQWISSEYPLPSSGRPQEIGSAITYARRYSLSAIVGNSADEDDDAEGAEASKQHIASNGKARPISERATPNAPAPQAPAKPPYTDAEEKKVVDGLILSIQALKLVADIDAFGKQPESVAIYARCSEAGKARIKNALRTQRDKLEPPSIAGAA